MQTHTQKDLFTYFKQNHSAEELVNFAKEYFTSLGFPSLGDDFDKNSVLERINPSMSCFPRAYGGKKYFRLVDS